MTLIEKIEQSIKELHQKQLKAQADILAKEEELEALKEELSEVSVKGGDNTTLLEKIERLEKSVNTQRVIYESLTSKALKNEVPKVLEEMARVEKTKHQEIQDTFPIVAKLKEDYNAEIAEIWQKRANASGEAIQQYAVAERILNQLGTKEQQGELKRFNPTGIFQNFDLVKVKTIRGTI